MKLSAVPLLGCMLILSSCAPNIYSDAGRRKLERVTQRVDTLRFEVETRGDLLWQGEARVTRMQDAVLELKGEDAKGPPCRTGSRWRGGSYTAGVRVHKYGGNANDADEYEFTVWVEHLDLTQDCNDRTRSTAQARAVRKLRAGQEFTFKGNSDLTIRIERTD